jgi:DNA-binding MarR family transcriptional regulator
MSLFAELHPLFPKMQGIGARIGLILEVLSNSPIGVWRSPSGATNIHVGTSENAGGCPFRFLYHTYAIHYHQAPLLISTGGGIKFVKHLSNILIRILFLVQLMYNLVSFVTRGSVRRKVIKGLLRPATTTELAKIIDVDRAAVSRTIHAMEKVGLVECLTPTENRDRYYRTSETGKKVLAIIDGKGE